MKYLTVIFFFSPLLLFSQIEEIEIKEVLTKQQKCWNAGDLECFMDGYWKSQKLTFIGKTGVIYGWEKMLERYKKSYPGKEAMGKLLFEVISVEPLGEYWFVIGKWTLDRKEEDTGGHFSLLWRFIDGKWVIVSDHSS